MFIPIGVYAWRVLGGAARRRRIIVEDGVNEAVAKDGRDYADAEIGDGNAVDTRLAVGERHEAFRQVADAADRRAGVARMGAGFAAHAGLVDDAGDAAGAGDLQPRRDLRQCAPIRP